MRLHSIILLTVVCSLAASAQNIQAATAAPYYSIADFQPIPGIAKWDYLEFDAPHHHLFITQGDHVDVYDTANGRMAGSIPDTAGVHGVALDPDLNRGFITDGKADSVTVFDLASLKMLGTVAVGQKPDAIIYDRASRMVFAANGDSSSLSAIDPAHLTVTGTVPLDAGPEFMAVDGQGRLYVNIEDKNEIEVVDSKAMKVAARYDISAGCEGPAGLAIDPGRHRLFAGCHNQKMAIVDAQSGKLLATPVIGQGSDAVRFDAGRNLAFSSNGDGTLTVIGPNGDDDYAVLQNVQTMRGARTMELDPVSHIIYLVTAESEGMDPPTAEHPKGRPHFKDGTFRLLTVKDQNAK